MMMTLWMGVVMMSAVRAATMLDFRHWVVDVVRGVLEPDDPSVVVHMEGPATTTGDGGDLEGIPCARNFGSPIRVENDRPRNFEDSAHGAAAEPLGHRGRTAQRLYQDSRFRTKSETFHDNVGVNGGFDRSLRAPRVEGDYPSPNCVIVAAVPHIGGNITSRIRAQRLMIIAVNFFLRAPIVVPARSSHHGL